MSFSPDVSCTPLTVLPSDDVRTVSTGELSLISTPNRWQTRTRAAMTEWNPPTGYQMPSASSVYCSSEYVPGASKGLIPIYILPKVKTLLSLSVQKYLEALEYMLSNGCSSNRCFKKLHLARLNMLVKFL